MMHVVLKMEKITMSAENVITRMKLALQMGDLEKMYEILKMKIPNKIKVALYMVYQFESSDFNFDVVHEEDKLQEEYEQLEIEEISKAAGEAGNKVSKKMK